MLSRAVSDLLTPTCRPLPHRQGRGSWFRIAGHGAEARGGRPASPGPSPGAGAEGAVGPGCGGAGDSRWRRRQDRKWAGRRVKDEDMGLLTLSYEYHCDSGKTYGKRQSSKKHYCKIHPPSLLSNGKRS